MASAVLNTGLMEALVARGPPVSSGDSPQEGSPASAGDNPSHRQHEYLHAHFAGALPAHYPLCRDARDASMSGEGSTDDENSIGDQLSHFYKQSSDNDNFLDASKKRRKQSKPIRLPASPHRPGQESTILDAQFDSENSNPLPDNEQIPLRCPHCPFESRSEDSLRRHIIDEHIGRMLSEEDSALQVHQARLRLANEVDIMPLNLTCQRWDDRSSPETRDNDTATPPSCIRMPASMMENKLNLPRFLPFGPPPFLIPFLQQERESGERIPMGMQQTHPILSSSSSSSSNGQQQRIFNPEAYCDLCHKEFCNKYFLKTHKANKHGIYTPEICGSPLGNVSIGSSFGSSTPLAPSVFLHSPIVSSALCASPLNVPPISASSLMGSPYAGAFIAASMNAIPIRPLLPTQIPSTSKATLTVNKESPITNKTGVINMEAYCELCQKEFCNKYFLKRHKSKIHGINIEVVTKPKNPPPQNCPSKSIPERPEGWCDACRRDIGSRASLNSHKLHVHGPHLVNPIPAPQNSLQPNKEVKNDPEKTLQTNKFSPWDTPNKNIKESPTKPESQLEHSELKQKKEHISAEVPVSMSPNLAVRSLWHNPFGPPWDMPTDVIVRSEHGKNSPEEGNSETWQEKEIQNKKWNEQLLQEVREEQHRELLMKDMHDNGSSDFPLNMQDMQAVRDNQVSDWKHKNHPFNYEQKQTEEIHRQTSIEEKAKIIEVGMKQNENDREITICQRIDFELKDDAKDDLAPEGTMDGQRTPDGSSSNDESSREAGMVRHLGHSTGGQIPPGTKFTTEQLRQLGVINPDAFCELCCKEFCNKYFLRTHRIKKHGIYTPEYSERIKQQKDSSPVNIVRLFERQMLDLRPSMQDIDGNLDCDVCHRPFPSPYLLQMHRYYFHGPGQEAVQQELLQSHAFHQDQLRQIAIQAQQQNSQDNKRQETEQDLQHQIHKRRNSGQEIRIPHRPFDNRSPELNATNTDLEFRYQEHKLSHTYSINNHHYEIIKSNSADLELPSPKETVKSASPCSPVIDVSYTDRSAASEDLQKLQSMILQLNRQGDPEVRCHLCHKDMANKYFLRAHMMTEHGMLDQDENQTQMRDSMQTPKTPQDMNRSTSPPTTPTGEGQAFCTICRKDFFSRYILQQHLLSAHGVFTPPSAPASFMDRIRAEVENRDDRKPQSASRSYCQICNKELCNKYFMKTHMMKMHGINLENGVSGGVTCELCNKELCSKYFLRVHKQNTHGLVEEGREGEEPVDLSDIEVCPLCARRFKNIKWLKMHLTSDHGDEGKDKWREMEVDLSLQDSPEQLSNVQACGLCGLMLPDLVSLQLHVIKTHAPPDLSLEVLARSQCEETRMPNLQCTMCSFVAPNSAILYAHARTHISSSTSFEDAISQQLPCPLCSQIFSNIESYQHHIIQHQIQGLLKPFLERESDMQDDTITNNLPQLEKIILGNGQSSTSSRRKRWQCSRCGKKFLKRGLCLAHVHAIHNPRARGTWLGRSTVQRQLFKCRKCGAVAKKRVLLKEHIHKCHKNESGVPATRATPTKSVRTKRYVMQPFLLNNAVGSNDSEMGMDATLKLVPSLVYLPVARRVHHPLTVAFNLTPA